MTAEVRKATGWALALTVVLGILILIGSRNLAHFDAALVAYTFAVLFATFGITYRYQMWLQRPPTRMYWRRGWTSFFRRKRSFGNLGIWFRRVGSEVLANRFIFKRDPIRGLAHLLIMWGCLIAVAITFPLVFGWLHFAPVPGELEAYTAVVFGFELFRFSSDSFLAFLLFHGLVWCSFLVIAGVMIATRRRMREEGAASVQRFAEDFMPLILLFAVSLTGLLLTASYTWMRGYAYNFLAITHAVTVIATFLWLPFGKFFHVFQRPAQIGVGFYKDAGREGEQAICRRCGAAYTSEQHVRDLIQVEAELGYDYSVDDPKVEHYQRICPPCRRATVALAQSAVWRGHRGGNPIRTADDQPVPTPVPANNGIGEGPLGIEDAENYHP